MGQRKSKSKKDNFEIPSIFDAPIVVQRDAEISFDPSIIPRWLTADLFEDILQEVVDDYVRVVVFRISPAVGDYEKQSSLVLRISIDVELKDKSPKTISFVLKVPYENGHSKNMVSFQNFLKSENQMYFEVIPELEQMYKDVYKDLEFAPKSYKFSKNLQEECILLEDLTPLGYKNADRIQCLDMIQSKFVLRKLAQFHAASATRVATKGPYPDMIMRGIFTNREAYNIFESFIRPYKKTFLDTIVAFTDGEQCEPFVRKCLDISSEDFENILSYNEAEFNVLNHGDCWSDNLIFKYNKSGRIEDMKFVDFQMPKYGSPAQDLYYFILSSLDIDIKLDQFEYLIRFYYDQLIENLKKLSYPKALPTLRELYVHLLKYGIWSLWTIIAKLPIVLSDHDNSENVSAINEDDTKLNNTMYLNPRYRVHINRILPWLYDRGLLEPYIYSSLRPDSMWNTISPKLVAATPTPTPTPTPATTPTSAPTPTPVESNIPALFQTPKWITESLFLEILEKTFEGFKKIKKLTVGPGTGSGENFTSLILKINIDVELDNKDIEYVSFLMKVALSNQYSKAAMKSMNVFTKEISIYKEFLPKFEDLYKKEGIDVKFGPKYFDLINKAEEDIVLLENLKPQGYNNCNRLNGLDEEHTKAVLRKIAQFHAASATYALEKDFPIVIQNGLYVEEHREFFEKISQSFLPFCMESVKSLQGHEEYYDKVVTCSRTFFDAMLEACKVEDNFLNVLNHGDLWTNNILFKYDENGKVENTILIDYQEVHYGSPAMDLYYFLISSPALDIKLEKFDCFVKYYHDQLSENLKLLKYSKKIPSLKELHSELLRKGVIGFSTTTGLLSAVLLDPTELSSMDNMLSEESAGIEMRKLMYSNSRYKKHAETIFPWLNRRGLLDAK